MLALVCADLIIIAGSAGMELQSGFRADTVHDKTWGVKGQTSVVERAGQRQLVSAASAVSARGGF